jgi:hypothetical protein
VNRSPKRSFRKIPKLEETFPLTTPTLWDISNVCESTNFDVSVQNKGQHVTDRGPCDPDGNTGLGQNRAQIARTRCEQK